MVPPRPGQLRVSRREQPAGRGNDRLAWDDVTNRAASFPHGSRLSSPSDGIEVGGRPPRHELPGGRHADEEPAARGEELLGDEHREGCRDTEATLPPGGHRPKARAACRPLVAPPAAVRPARRGRAGRAACAPGVVGAGRHAAQTLTPCDISGPRGCAGRACRG